MTATRTLVICAVVIVAGAVGWILFVGLPRWPGATIRTTALSTLESLPEDTRKITARLYYVSGDGTRLASVEREVPFAEQTVAQARRIIEAQLAPVDAPLVTAIPAGTTLRALFVTGQGSAFVDLSREIAAVHPGGTLNELLTVYTIVQALTTNLPAITSVQLLVDGKEVDTLAGHVDLTRPLPRDDVWVEENVSQ